MLISSRMSHRHLNIFFLKNQTHIFSIDPHPVFSNLVVYARIQKAKLSTFIHIMSSLKNDRFLVNLTNNTHLMCIPLFSLFLLPYHLWSKLLQYCPLWPPSVHLCFYQIILYTAARMVTQECKYYCVTHLSKILDLYTKIITVT